MFENYPYPHPDMMQGGPMMGDPRKQKNGMSLGSMLGMLSPMGYMMAHHPQMGLAMMSPGIFGLSKLFK